MTAASREGAERPCGGGSAILSPLATLYGLGVAVARRGGRARAETPGNARVVAVGGLESGGSGKTPLAMLLLEELVSRGERCAYVSRGYGSRSARSQMVTRVPEQAPATARLSRSARVVARLHPCLPREIGDEAAVVTGRLPDVPLFISGDKARAVVEASACGAAVVVVDDAFQSWRVPRSRDVVVLDARCPIGNGRLLPAGRLRERPSALRRADAVVFNGVKDEADVARAREVVARWLRRDASTHGVRRMIRLVSTETGMAGEPAHALLASAIARPAGFVDAVKALGIDVVGQRAFRDHHFYDAADARALAEDCRTRACALVTTEKDWVKLRSFRWEGVQVWVARLDLEWVGPRPEV